MPIKILPSLLSADFANLLPAIRAVEAGGADLLHLDVMDGRFVPNITLGPPVVAAVRKATKLPLDCHLMIIEPSRYLDSFMDAGANFISFHIEAEPHAHRALQQLKNRKVGAGLVLNPLTSASLLEPALELVDYILVMSVNPGFGGQSFIPEVLRKVEWLAAERSRRGLTFAIEIDGGITTKTIAQCVNAGCDWFVAGTAVFGAADPGAAIAELRRAASA